MLLKDTYMTTNTSKTTLIKKMKKLLQIFKHTSKLIKRLIVPRFKVNCIEQIVRSSITIKIQKKS